jgi:hypothetical protein
MLFCLYEIFRIGKSIESENRIVVVKGWRGGRERVSDHDIPFSVKIFLQQPAPTSLPPWTCHSLHWDF